MNAKKRTEVFKDYAKYYDLFYQEKDYESECGFIEAVFKKYAPGKIHSVIDWGCGTGTHALKLQSMGYSVTGVDASREMIQQALLKAKKQRSKASFVNASVVNPPPLPVVDAAISMFAVVGYQITNTALLQMFSHVRRTLRTGGLFLFDCWHGAAVVLDHPHDRHSEFRDGKQRIIRLAHPVIHWAEQVVDVHYRLLILEGSQLRREIEEQHEMRFFFIQELAFILQQSGFQLIHCGPTYNLAAPVTPAAWNIFCIAEAVEVHAP
jgi:SAM-dependent methyltransferase